jgi:hypothetical protein
LPILPIHLILDFHMRALEQLLFFKKLGDNGAPLFNRPVEIVRALQSTPGSFYYKPDLSNESEDKDFNNLKVIVSQLLKGKRTASNKLVESLIEVIRPRINETFEAENIIEEIKGYLVKKNDMYAAAETERDLEELNERYSNSGTQVVFNARPEDSYDNKRAAKFVESILDSLSLLDDDCDIENITTRYEYHFFNSFIALDYFDVLLNKAIELKGIEWKDKIKKDFQELNEKGFINIYVVQDVFTVFPHTVFNHLSQNMCGFIFFPKDANNFSIAKMSKAALQRWFRYIYLPAKYSRQELTFARYLEYKTNAVIDRIGQDLNTSPNRFDGI